MPEGPTELRVANTRTYSVQTILLACLVGIAIIAALRAAQSLVAPVLVGLMVGIVMVPAVRRLDGWGVPRAVGALLGMVLAVALLAALLLFASPIVMEFVAALPRLSEVVREWAVETMRLFRGVEQLGASVSDLTESGEAAVEEALPNVIGALWLAPNLVGQIFITVGTIFFFILTRDEIYKATGPATYARLGEADRAVSHYFLTITLINTGLGVAVATAMSLIGLSNPLVWGAAAALLNFVLYLGPAIIAVSLLIAGLIEFGGVMALLPPLAFMCLNLIEAQFATPSLVGHRLSLNPLAVFLAIIFGLWLWGPVGGIVALPCLVWVYVLLKGPPVTDQAEAQPRDAA